MPASTNLDTATHSNAVHGEQRRQAFRSKESLADVLIERGPATEQYREKWAFP
jgi:hypothetical protein